MEVICKCGINVLASQTLNILVQDRQNPDRKNRRMMSVMPDVMERCDGKMSRCQGVKMSDQEVSTKGNKYQNM